MKNIDRKRLEAQERQAEYNTLTTAQKIMKLDVGKHKASKQRVKLAAQYEIDRQEAGKQILETAKKLEKKNYQKPKRS